MGLALEPASKFTTARGQTVSTQVPKSDRREGGWEATSDTVSYNNKGTAKKGAVLHILF